MSKLYTVALLVQLTCVLVLAHQLINLKAQNVETTKQYVFAVCNLTRVSPDLDESDCAVAQDDNNMEFLCKERNALVTNHCWVEVK